MAKKRGRFITFEGTEGAGKSTLIRLVEEELRRRKVDLVVTREPGGTGLAEKVRALLLYESMGPLTELFLYEAARAEHLDKTVLPALDEGRWVLCDRFTDSTLAYQAHARGIPWKIVSQANRLATGGLKPDLTVFLDVDPAVGLARSREQTRFEAEGVEFQKRVRAGFLRARREEPKRWVTLNVTSTEPAESAHSVLQHIDRRFLRNKL